MKSPTIYKCSPEYVESWWIPLEEAGLNVELLASHAIVKSAGGTVAIHPNSDGDLMLIYKGQLFSRKNLYLAQKINDIFLKHIQ